jgi:tetratricopeptide (TPR) repeat protein
MPAKKGKAKQDFRKQNQKPGKQLKKNRYAYLAGLSIIILLGIIIYSNSFLCTFHFDDTPRIVENTAIRNLADIHAWWTTYPLRPVGMFTFALNYHFNQLDVRYYHLVNLLIHLINSCLVWWLTLLFFSSPALKDNTLSRHKKSIAFLTALLFVSHPLATQSVTYIVQRMASLVAMFYLLSLALYMKARLGDKHSLSGYLLFAGSLISAALAMLTKENAITLPFAVLLSELFFLRKKELPVNFKDYRLWLAVAVILGLAIIIPLMFPFGIFKPIPPSFGNSYTITPLNYLFTQFPVIMKYIQLLFLPVIQNLDYDFPLSTGFFGIRTMISFLCLLSLIFLAIFLFRRYRIISFGIFWFFLTLSVESGIIPISDLIFEHRTYLPSFGFFLVLGSGLYLLLWDNYKYLAIFVFVVLIGSNSVMAYERNKVWKDDLTLWSDAVLKSPGKARPLTNRGIAYGNLGQWDKALSDYTRAIEINPEYFEAVLNHGFACANLEQWEKAIADYSRAIGINPKSAFAFSNRGIAYGHLGNYVKAIADCSKAIEINPYYIKAYFNRGVIYGSLGQWEKSIDDYSGVIALDPKYAQAYINRGSAYGSLGQWDKAIADCSVAIGINPEYAKAYYNRGVAYCNLGQWDKAAADFSRVIGIDPGFKAAYAGRDFANGKMQGGKKP